MWRFAFPAVVVLALVGAACSSGSSSEPYTSGSPSASAQLTQSAEAGGVTVDATWLTADDTGGLDADLSQYPADKFVLIKIAFTTHSGDLNSVDMQQAADLVQNGLGVPPEAWVSLSDDSHHREGVLVFPRDLKADPVELVVSLEDEAVKLRWETVPGS